jgi:NAD(P)-dependent dehydrogenase (short-subunit alcohol dehydrogenase family)
MTFQTNIHAMFYLTKAAVPHMKPGSAIINTASINADMPNPILLAYATTKGAIQKFYRRPCADARGKRHPRQRSRPRSDLDTADPLDNA